MGYLRYGVDWARRHGLALIFAGIFGILALYMNVPYTSQTKQLYLLMLLQGALSLLSVKFLSDVFAVSPLLFVVFTMAWGLVLGLIVELALTGTRHFVILLLGINQVCVGSFFLFFYGFPVLDTCEHFVSELNGVRIIHHVMPTRGYGDSPPFADFSYQVTRDGGEHWTEIMDFFGSKGGSADCEKIKSLDENFFWVWGPAEQREALAITHDGGQTWLHWNPQHLWPKYGKTIVDVDFDSNQTGQISLIRSRYLEYTQSFKTVSVTLYTEDGGVTWHERDP
jgi:hypothetical protein